jgi:glycosyltransferase involved in cell wall biosynthesis
MRISAVVPVYNEAQSLAFVHSELSTALGKLGGSYEIIYVDDGSTDGSATVLRSLKGATVLFLNRNYGQATALDAGFKAATGDIVVSLDADGQNDPADIPRLLEKLHTEGLDVVAGWRTERRDPAQTRILSRIGRAFRQLLVGDVIHDSGCTLRVYRSEAVKSLDLGGEMHRYIVSLLHWKGFRIGELPVNHRPRRYGRSKYGGSKALRGFFDLLHVWFIHKYSSRPVHFFGYVSFGAFLVALLSGALAVYEKVAWSLSLNRNGWFFVALFFMLASLICFSLGIVFDFLIRIHFNSSPYERRYRIRETVSVP